MRLSDFEAMVVRMAGEVPREFLDGVAEIVVSPRTLPHPERPGIFTLGECIPLPAAADAGPESIQSRIVLYHGSFAALATVTLRAAAVSPSTVIPNGVPASSIRR